MSRRISYEDRKVLEARGNSEVVLGMADALKFIRIQPAGASFMFGGRVNLPIEGEPDRIFPGYACVTISRQQALDLVRDLLENLGKRGARVRITVRGAYVHI